jgi:hypothetical protein
MRRNFCQTKSTSDQQEKQIETLRFDLSGEAASRKLRVTHVGTAREPVGIKIVVA